MRGSSSGMWLSGRSDALTLAGELPVSIEIRSIRGARRLRLRYDDARGVLKLTCPVRTSRRAALAWALDQREWIDTQLARSLPGEPFAPNAIIPIEGRETRLIWEKAAARTPRFDSGELRCGGPPAGVRLRHRAPFSSPTHRTLSTSTLAIPPACRAPPP